ncbi:DNA methyltransferase [Weissella confusa]|uniref:DNA adenine methylase n=1 Tax=Weissella confusa TaxID=1583 RepID=UPI000DCA6E48|nr:DNA adenine methylase [Weissella confusa]MBJ7694051.1 DNA adenine methylase [Weissella confusa]QBZ04367.1 DNA methyltransferase [Weissella confusa]RAU08333.1 DNA methyltransferase [Weissella confusa]
MVSTFSPLRYPGGKSQLYKFVEGTLSKNSITGTYIEPFAGGAGIAIELLLKNKVSKIVINDFDPSIYSVWYAIINHAEALVELLSSVPFDYATRGDTSPADLANYWNYIKEVHDQFDHDPNSIQNAFTTLMLNRMNVSGIISGGPIGGRTQQGKYKLDSRFNKDTLIKKIMAIAARSADIDLYKLDANELITVISNEPKYEPDNTFIFFDPPYYVQGKNLYLSFINNSQHAILAKNILAMDDYFWITTYDSAPQIADIYHSASQKYTYSLNYTANKRGKFSEYLFASAKTKLAFIEKMSVIAQ